MFKDLTIDFNGVNNLLPVGQIGSNSGTGQVKTIYGIDVSGKTSSANFTIDSMTFLNNAGRNDAVFNGPGTNLVIKNSVFKNGGRNVGSLSTQNVNHTDFSFIYSDWDNSTFNNDSIYQQYPEITLQLNSYSGGIEIHSKGAVMTNSYVYGCKPGVYVSNQKSDGTIVENILIRKNKILDCAWGVSFWAQYYLNNITIDSNTISTMFLKTATLTPSQAEDDGHSQLACIYCAHTDNSCRVDYEDPNSVNISPINGVTIAHDSLSFDYANSLSPANGQFSTTGVLAQSFQNSRIDSNYIGQMNLSGISLKGSPWGMNSVKIRGNTISNFEYNYKTYNSLTSAFIIATDSYLPNSDCNPSTHEVTYKNMVISGNSFETNTVTTNESGCTSSSYNCFKNMYFALPVWYAYTSTPTSPFSANVLNSQIFSIQSGGSYDNYISAASCTATGCLTLAAPTGMEWYDVLSNNSNTLEKLVTSSGTGCMPPSPYSTYCNIGYKLLANDGISQTWTITAYDNGSLVNTVTKHGNPVMIVRGVDYPQSVTVGHTEQISVSVQSDGYTGSYTDNRYLACIDPDNSATCTVCLSSPYTFTGNYGVSNTQSPMYIQSSGTSTIAPNEILRMDAKSDDLLHPANEYYILLQTTGNDYVLLAPAIQDAFFVAAPLDGCGLKIVNLSRPFNQELSLYPNPAHDAFNITVHSSISNNNLLLKSIQVYDMGGKVIKVSAYQVTSDHIIIRCNGLSKGVYIVKIYTKDSMFVKKVVVL